MKFAATINKLHIHPADPVRYGKHLLSLEGKKVVVDIEKMKKLTTLDQYSYLNAGIFPEISQFTGHTVDEVKEYFCLKFHFRIIEINQVAVRISRSLGRLTTSRDELSAFISNIIIFMAPTLTISPPN